jgi:LacI family transcriptional regulator
MTATINDVAREAGVSITTVSRVLNNNYPVKQETRQKIENAIEKLRYEPNAMARSLITKKTAMIGVVVPGITNLFFPTIVEAIEEYAKTKGYSISLCNTGGDSNAETDVVQKLVSRQVDGLVVIDPTIENLEKEYYEKLSKTVPIILVNGAPSGTKCNFVCYDEEIGASEAFKYLLKLGHKKIAFVRGHKSFSYDIKEKMYLDMIKDKGLTYKKVLNVGKGNKIEVVESTESQVEKLLLQEERPTAVFACNDLMAVGVINACRKSGVNVPEDMSVIGFDNTLLAEVTHPKLTSVDQNMKQIGHRAALELLDIIENGSQGRKTITLDTKLIVRESCGKIKKL